MMFLPRSLAARLRLLIRHFPVVVVSGARQVGKSTLLAHELPDWASVVLDPVIDTGNARTEPDLFLDAHPAPLIIDEVQYAPELVAAVKRRVDQDRRPGRYVLTGSQQWGVLRALSESLAGRAAFLDLEGLSVREQAGRGDGAGWLEPWLVAGPDAFLARPSELLPLGRPLHEVVWRGSLPEAWTLPPELVLAFHSAYRRTYIERDVRLLSNLSDHQRFGRFLQLVSALTAQEINHSQLGRELDVAGSTAQSWLGLLTATFQWCELPAWSGNTIKRVSLRPKGHIADTGLACSALAISSPSALAGHPNQGALIESAWVGEVRKQAAAMAAPPNLYHWRSHRGAEVDLVLERDGRLFPIEMKATTHPDRKTTSGIAAFREVYGAAVGPGLVICAVDRPLRLTAQDLAIPWNLVIG